MGKKKEKGAIGDVTTLKVPKKMTRTRKGSIVQHDRKKDYTGGRKDVLSFDVVYKGDRMTVSFT